MSTIVASMLEVIIIMGIPIGTSALLSKLTKRKMNLKASAAGAFTGLIICKILELF